ncbi:MAG: four helix bundle protein [Planctomycetes bacterium]|nr:four helix bundle protein [Planctomycetota bacterium]
MGETLETLKAYQLARAFRKEAFKISRRFPRDDIRGAAHMRETARQMTQNMAEGYHRNGYAEKIQFFRFALTSTEELIDQIDAACDAGYITSDELSRYAAQGKEVLRVTVGYIKFLERQRSAGDTR